MNVELSHTRNKISHKVESETVSKTVVASEVSYLPVKMNEPIVTMSKMKWNR